MIEKKNALLTADKKIHLMHLVAALHPTHNIISLGGTGYLIKPRVPVIQTVDFLRPTGYVPIPIKDKYSETTKKQLKRMNRELAGSYLAQCLALEDDTLNALGRPGLDMAYVNLLRSEPLTDDLGRYNGVKLDKGGIDMIHGAVEGGKPVLVTPNQIPEYTAHLRTDEEKFYGLSQGPQCLAKVALQHLSGYESAGSSAGHVTIVHRISS